MDENKTNLPTFAISCFPPYKDDGKRIIILNNQNKTKLIKKSPVPSTLYKTTKYTFPEWLDYTPSYHPNSIYTLGNGSESDPIILNPLYVYGKHPWYILLADTLSKGVDAALLNEDNKRVENMLKSNLELFFNISPRRIAAALDASGSVISYYKHPGTIAASVGLAIPQTAFNVYDVVTNPNISNNFEMGLLIAAKIAEPVVRATNVKLPIPKWTKVTRVTPTGSRYSTRMYNPTIVNITTPAKVGALTVLGLDFIGNVNLALTEQQTYEMLFGLPHEPTFHDVINIYKDENGNIKMKDPYLYNNEN